MTAKKLFLFSVLLLCQCVFAQQDSIALKEVVISDSHLKNFTQTRSIQVLNDSVIEKNRASLTSLLNYNSVIYFKENGLGMVSSPSFRGTTAQQTAVIWNGININSQFNGQTDFNTISTRDFNSVAVQAGGGSTIYGSSAIGGSVHLSNELSFKKQFTNNLYLSFGSFNTLNVNYKLNVSDEKWSTQITLSRNSSDNDYRYSDTNLKNENGQFYNTSLNANFAYKINRSNFLKFYSQIFESERHFSGTLAAPSKSKYRDLNTRNLFEWDGFFNAFTSKLKVAFLEENYAYFENEASENCETAQAETFIAKYDLNYKWNATTGFNVIVDFTRTHGKGTQIETNSRNTGAAVLMMKKNIYEKFDFEMSLRKEITALYESPLLYNFGMKYTVSQHYDLKLNASRSFRIPTINDLYWQGNNAANLKPELADQIELGQELKFLDFNFSVNLYYIDINDLLVWTPKGNLWTPENIGNVTNYGSEILAGWKKHFGNHNINLNSSYAYTVSTDEQTGKQLLYVPFHKWNANGSYSYKKMTVTYQFLFNGAVFTNSKKYNVVQEYSVSNLGIDYDFGNKNRFQTGFQIFNIWNENYQSVSLRPMPGRNFAINLTFKF